MRKAACGWYGPPAVETHENWLEQHRYLSMAIVDLDLDEISAIERPRGFGRD
jgi:hypothetical protein